MAHLYELILTPPPHTTADHQVNTGAEFAAILFDHRVMALSSTLPAQYDELQLISARAVNYNR